jgi:hypothetical protein
MFNRKRKPYTAAETDRVALIKSAGCVCCTQLHRRDTGLPVEFNHHLRAGRRIGNDVGTGECAWHHRGEPKFTWTKREMLEHYGPARTYPGSKPFHARFGTDAELRERQERMIRGEP